MGSPARGEAGGCGPWRARWRGGLRQSEVAGGGGRSVGGLWAGARGKERGGGQGGAGGEGGQAGGRRAGEGTMLEEERLKGKVGGLGRDFQGCGCGGGRAGGGRAWVAVLWMGGTELPRPCRARCPRCSWASVSPRAAAVALTYSRSHEDLCYAEYCAHPALLCLEVTGKGGCLG